MPVSEQSPPTVPLEAGIGPENPPCPACGEPLFGWAEAPDGEPILRCEACGLGVEASAVDADALAALERRRAGDDDGPRYSIANRASLQAWLGGGGWAAVGPGSRHLFTAEAVRRLVAARDQEVARVRWRPGRSLALMWGTLINTFTFGRNVALGALGIAAAVPAPRAWQRVLDWFVSAVLAAPVLVLALLLEAGAAAVGRGGVLDLTLRLA